MNTFKNVLFFGLLIAVLCLVGVVLTRPPEQPLPAGLSKDTTPPIISDGQMIPSGPPGVQSSSPPGLPAQLISSSPQQGGDGGLAPAFQPPQVSVPPNFPKPISSDSGALALPLPPRDPTSPPAGLDYPPGVRDPFRAGNAAGQSSSPPSIGGPPPLPTPPANSGGPALPFQPLVTAGPPSAAPPSPSGSDAANSGARGSSRRDFTSGSGGPVSTNPPPADRASLIKIDQTIQQYNRDVETNRVAEALFDLSQLYGNPDLPPKKAEEVTRHLDQMAAKVIYSSREHLLQKPYRVQAGDTLDKISDYYHVPALLLAKINVIQGPKKLPPGMEPEILTQALPLGMELKVLKGPFSAQISTDRSEMTMWLAGHYAGRFIVALSNDLSHAQGMWRVVKKGPSTVAAGYAPGKQWMELVDSANGNISVQGTDDSRVAFDRNSHKTIWLSLRDMDDVFAILSVESSVIIQR